VTPLVAFTTADGSADTASMNALVEHQLNGGVAGVLVNGSMGEVGNLSETVRAAMIRTVVDAVAGRVPVWAGVAGLGTVDTAEAARKAEAGGVDALLVLPPLFFEFSDDELRRHFEVVAKSVTTPVIAYDVPPRSRRKMSTELIGRLGDDGVIAGVKDSSGSITSARAASLRTADIAGFGVYLGTEAAIDAAPALGARGSVPGIANIAPGVAVDADAGARAGKVADAEAAQRILIRLLSLLDLSAPGAGATTVAVNAFKAATAIAMGRPAPAAVEPMATPDASFVEAVRRIVAGALPA